MLLAVAPAGAQTFTDYDADDNGLIEVDSLQKLAAIYHDLDGNGESSHADYASAFPMRDTNAATRMGCPGGNCTGYELTADLTFPAATGTYNPFWPIGNNADNFNAVFDGQGHTVTGQTVPAASTHSGLFGVVGGSGVIRNVGVINPTVTVAGGANNPAGGLVGEVAAGGVISQSYVRGGTVNANGNSVRVGGLVGLNRGTIRASYSTASVGTTSGGSSHYGGLVGRHIDSGALIASYAAGPVSPSGSSNIVGGLVGRSEDSATITDGRWDTGVTGQTNAVGAVAGTGTITASGHNAADLQRPTGYSGIYANWNIDTDGMTGGDDPWDFGASSEYPALKFDTDGNGTPTAYEFGGQGRPDPNAPPRVRLPARGGGQPYNWRTDHPEIYANARNGITASCEVQTTGTGDDAVTTATITFDLAEYTRPITLALSLWDRTHFRSLQSLGIAMPALQREGQTATVEVATDPARTRFRLDGQYGLNLVLGYADCHTDDS